MKSKKSDTSTMGGRIRFRRNLIGMTQEELGAMIGVDNKANISAYENNNRSVSLTMVPVMAEALGTTVEYLVTGKEPWLDIDDHEFSDEVKAALQVVRGLKTRTGIRMAVEHLKLVAEMEKNGYSSRVM